MGYTINPLACVSFGGNKSGKKSAAKKPQPAPAPVAKTTETTEGNQSAAAAPTVAPKRAAGKRRKAEEKPYRGGFLPYRPLWSYNIDPVANAMYFHGGVIGGKKAFNPGF
jgi:hypothetical protein